MHHPQAKEIKVGAPVHRAFNQFQAMDMPLDLTLTPRMFKCCPDRRFIVPEIPCKLTHFTYRTCGCVCHPRIKCSAKSISKHLGEALAHLKELLELTMERTQLIQRRDFLRTAL